MTDLAEIQKKIDKGEKVETKELDDLWNYLLHQKKQKEMTKRKK